MTTLTRTAHRVNPPREYERFSFWDYNQDDLAGLLLFWSVVVLVLFAVVVWIDTHPEHLSALINFGR